MEQKEEEQESILWFVTQCAFIISIYFICTFYLIFIYVIKGRGASPHKGLALDRVIADDQWVSL